MLQTLPIIGVGSRAAVVTTDQLSLDNGRSFYYIFTIRTCTLCSLLRTRRQCFLPGHLSLQHVKVQSDSGRGTYIGLRACNFRLVGCDDFRFWMIRPIFRGDYSGLGPVLRVRPMENLCGLLKQELLQDARFHSCRPTNNVKALKGGDACGLRGPTETESD